MKSAADHSGYLCHKKHWRTLCSRQFLCFEKHWRTLRYAHDCFHSLKSNVERSSRCGMQKCCPGNFQGVWTACVERGVCQHLHTRWQPVEGRGISLVALTALFSIMSWELARFCWWWADWFHFSFDCFMFVSSCIFCYVIHFICLFVVCNLIMFCVC